MGDVLAFRRRQGGEAWVTKQELARHLRYSVRWVELRAREGMPCRRIGGRMRFQVSVVEAWLAQNRPGEHPATREACQ